MAETKKQAAVTEWAQPSPAPAVEADLEPGPNQVVVTSPVGTKSVVDKAAVDTLKSQGYTVG